MAKALARTEVAEQIYHMRKMGMTLAEIQKDYNESGHNYTLAQIGRMYRGFMESLRAEWGEDERDHIRHLELERLDSLQQALWHQAMEGEPKAIETILKVMAQRQKLTGMDMPSGADPAAVQQILIIGQDKQAFIEALQHGRSEVPPGGLLAGRVEDDDEEEVTDD